MSVSEHGATSNTRIATNETCNITQKHAVHAPSVQIYNSNICTWLRLSTLTFLRPVIGHW